MAVYRNNNVIFVTAAQAAKQIWSGPGCVARVILQNADAGGAYVKLYDATTSTASKQIFEATLDQVGSDASQAKTFELGARFATALAVVLTGNAAKATIVIESD